MTLFRKLFTIDCCECKQLKVWFWNCRCEFCDIGEGQILGVKNDTN